MNHPGGNSANTLRGRGGPSAVTADRSVGVAVAARARGARDRSRPARGRGERIAGGTSSAA